MFEYSKIIEKTKMKLDNWYIHGAEKIASFPNKLIKENNNWNKVKKYEKRRNTSTRWMIVGCFLMTIEDYIFSIFFLVILLDIFRIIEFFEEFWGTEYKKRKKIIFKFVKLTIFDIINLFKLIICIISLIQLPILVKKFYLIYRFSVQQNDRVFYFIYYYQLCKKCIENIFFTTEKLNQDKNLGQNKEKEKSKIKFENLPTEMILEIASYLSIRDVIHLQRSNSNIYFLLENDFLWKEIFFNYLKTVSPVRPLRNRKDYLFLQERTHSLTSKSRNHSNKQPITPLSPLEVAYYYEYKNEISNYKFQLKNLFNQLHSKKEIHEKQRKNSSVYLYELGYSRVLHSHFIRTFTEIHHTILLPIKAIYYFTKFLEFLLAQFILKFHLQSMALNFFKIRQNYTKEKKINFKNSHNLYALYYCVDFYIHLHIFSFSFGFIFIRFMYWNIFTFFRSFWKNKNVKILQRINNVMNCYDFVLYYPWFAFNFFWLFHPIFFWYFKTQVAQFCGIFCWFYVFFYKNIFFCFASQIFIFITMINLLNYNVPEDESLSLQHNKLLFSYLNSFLFSK